MKKTLLVAVLALATTACADPVQGDREANVRDTIVLDGHGTKDAYLERYCDEGTLITIAKTGMAGNVGGLVIERAAPECRDS